MHKIFFAAQQKGLADQNHLQNPKDSFKLLIKLNFFASVYLLSNPVGTLIFKALRLARHSYQQSYPQKIWASSTSV